eukprot:3156124-Pyramimonas_sp.AAC.1
MPIPSRTGHIAVSTLVAKAVVSHFPRPRGRGRGAGLALLRRHPPRISPARWSHRLHARVTM